MKLFVILFGITLANEIKVNKLGGWKFLVSLNRRNGEFFCDGNAITKNLAITTKRCLEDKSEDEVKIRSGFEDSHIFATNWHSVLKFFFPNTKFNSKPIDLALMKVDPSFDNFAMLPGDLLDVFEIRSRHATCHAVFWKKSENSDVLNLEEYQTEIVRINTNQILSNLGTFEVLNTKRDSGAPLVCPDERNNSILVGILSRGNRENRSKLALYENLAFSLGWIRKRIEKENKIGNKTTLFKNVMKFKSQREANGRADKKYLSIIMFTLIFVT